MSDAADDQVEVPIETGALRAEYERELGTWLRRRLGYLCIAYVIFQIVSTAGLIFVSIGRAEQAAPTEQREPTPIERRAEQAERRADAGLTPRPGDRRAIEIANTIREREERELEERERARARGAEAVVSSLDAFSSIVRDFADDVTSGGREQKRGARRAAPRPGPIDRWYLDAPGESAELATPADRPALAGDRRSGETDDVGTQALDLRNPQPLINTEAPNPTLLNHELPNHELANPESPTPESPTTESPITESPTTESQTTESPITESKTELPTTNLPSSAPSTPLTVDDEFDPSTLPWWIFTLLAAPVVAVTAWFGLVVRPKLYTRTELVTAASRMILILGLINFVFESALLLAIPDAWATPLISIFFWHLTASLFLPWTWRESLKPIAPLLVCWLLLSLGLAVPQNDWLELVGKLLAVPFLFAPALVICYARLQWHRNRFKSGFIGRRFLEMRREYQQARAVHESLFPKPIVVDWMRFDFGYRPAADIGGDFIHVWTDDHDRFHLALIDVTGHGLTSAMSVARIHGEIERLRDEHPNDGPAKLLARLNRYFHRLLARHQLYATAILLTIDPRSGELRYASAGHPPIFLRSRGDVTELASTTFLLGAVDNDEFGEDEASIQLEERDTLILFTDGAYDAKSPRGERFGLERLREIVSRPVAPPRWTQFLMRLVETFEAGMAEDDLLIAEVAFLQRRSVSWITGDAPPSPSQTQVQSQDHGSFAGASA